MSKYKANGSYKEKEDHHTAYYIDVDKHKHRITVFDGPRTDGEALRDKIVQLLNDDHDECVARDKAAALAKLTQYEIDLLGIVR